MDGAVESAENAMEFVYKLVVRAIGLLFALVGLLLVSSTVVPADAEEGFILVLGLLVVALGGYALLKPENVTMRSRHDDEDEKRGRTGRRRR